MKRYLTKAFTFEAAHSLSKTKNIRNNNIHGHSFHVEITLKGQVNKNGMIVDFADLDELVGDIKNKLDHSFLNDIDGIGIPTLENIGNHIFKEASRKKFKIYRIEISRKTCNESFIIES